MDYRAQGQLDDIASLASRLQGVLSAATDAGLPFGVRHEACRILSRLYASCRKAQSDAAVENAVETWPEAFAAIADFRSTMGDAALLRTLKRVSRIDADAGNGFASDSDSD